MLPPPGVDDLPCNPVEDNEAVFAVLHPLTWDDEDRGVEFRDRDLPVPVQTADLGIPASGVHGEECHVGQMFR